MDLLDCAVFDSLSYRTLCKLVAELSLESPVPERDWRGFADRIGFSFRHIRTLEQQSRPGKAMEVLQIWDYSGKSSLRKLILALIHLSLISCLDVLKEDEDLLQAVDFDALAAEAAELKQGTRLQDMFPRLKDDEVLPLLLNLSVENTFIHHIPQTVPNCMSDHHHHHHHQRERHSLLGASVANNSVYISYYPESNLGFSHRKFRQQLTDLANLLRGQRYTVYCDVFCSKKEIRQHGGLNCWKEYHIQRAENILVVCTPKYLEEDSILCSPELRHRITNSPLDVDSKLLRDVAYSSKPERLIPLVLDRDRDRLRNCIPIWLSSPPHLWPSGRNRLIRCIEGIPEYQLPEPSQRIVLKPKIINFPEAYKHNPRDMSL